MSSRKEIMMKPILSSIWLKPIIILLISSHLFGCYTWKETHRLVEEIFAKNPEDLKMVKSDREKLIIHNPIVKQDILKDDSLLYTFSHALYKICTTSIPFKEINKVYLNKLTYWDSLLMGSVIFIWIVIISKNLIL
jgi:hypothetical protein